MNTTQDRLSIFVPDMTAGGAERATLNLVKGMAKRGYDVDLVLGRAFGSLLQEVPTSVRVIDLKSSRILSCLPALVRYLKFEKPVTMYSIMNHTSIIALWARRLAGVSTKVVVSVRNTLSNSSQHASSLSGRLMPLLIKRYYPYADGIVTVSLGVADDLAQVMGIPVERIHTIYNPVVTPELREKVGANLNHPWFSCGEPPVILGVGRLVEQKDFPTLIRAFSCVYQARPCRLLILGQGTERPILEALVSQLGLWQDVSLPGYVDNPYPYMAAASVFVLPSRWEGLPGVLIEALYCGVPLVATDCPGGSREILANGKYGRLVPVGDVIALAQAIEESLVENPPVPPPESWQRFELENAVDQYISVLMES
jgi:glycosyltransferase involved in cell wall biosynthesis